MGKMKNEQGSLDINRRNFLKIAGMGAVAAAATVLTGGTALAASEEQKPAHGSHARNALKAAGSSKGGKADLLILGNVITMDEYKPFAEAVAIKGDTILYVGEADVAKKLCDSHTKIQDYGKNSVYPGFLEAHCHPGAGGYNMTGKVLLDPFGNVDSWLAALKKYVADNPQKDVISGEGFSTSGALPTAAMLDAICSDKNVVVESYDKHSMWMQTATQPALSRKLPPSMFVPKLKFLLTK